jgi:YegS/Rv2252/BmrU family lipid kinase
LKQDRWFVVVNPKAGSNKGKEHWPEIKNLLEAENFDFDFAITQYQRQAIQLVRQAVENGFRNFISVGGDGTLNEVINGIFMNHMDVAPQIILGVITVGTGNDWGRTHKMPDGYAEMVKVIKKKKLFSHDIGKAKYRFDDENKSRYFINIAGMGFDAMVAKRVNTLKEKGYRGLMVYMFSLLSSLIQFKPTKLTIFSENEKIYSNSTFLASIGICRFNGGGMKLLPDAIPDDGLFDLTIIRKVARIKVLANIKNVFDGSFVKLKEVERFRAKSFTVVSDPPHALNLETDGESLGSSPLDFEVLPKAVNMIVP